MILEFRELKRIKETRIYGYNLVVQNVGVENDLYGVPYIKKVKILKPSENPLEVFKGELFIGQTYDETLQKDEKYIYLQEGRINVISEIVDDDVLKIVVNRLIKEEEQHFNKEIIEKEYEEKTKKCWEKFIKEYENNEEYEKLAFIKFLQEGMGNSEIMRLIMSGYFVK